MFCTLYYTNHSSMDAFALKYDITIIQKVIYQLINMFIRLLRFGS